VTVPSNSPGLVESPFLAPFDGSFHSQAFPTRPPKGAPGKKAVRERLEACIGILDEQQRRLYAHRHHALLLIFQAMDAAGKDGTIRAVMRGIDPAGCHVYSFKQPSTLELNHDFLWRTTCCLPERGNIGIFNRSYYEEVLAVRVHPEYLQAQRLPEPASLSRLWQERYESIRCHEQHLARNGTLVLKFWLNISREEQRKRFLARIDEPEKNWKFSESDVRDREHWDAYMEAYQEAIASTARPWAPWYVIPADNKPYMRLCVAEIITASLQQLELDYPRLSETELQRIQSLRSLLE
jgi:PPK2 family polyphosphate:nucleotide phosphotransferase